MLPRGPSSRCSTARANRKSAGADVAEDRDGRRQRRRCDRRRVGDRPVRRDPGGRTVRRVRAARSARVLVVDEVEHGAVLRVDVVTPERAAAVGVEVADRDFPGQLRGAALAGRDVGPDDEARRRGSRRARIRRQRLRERLQSQDRRRLGRDRRRGDEVRRHRERDAAEHRDAALHADAHVGAAADQRQAAVGEVELERPQPAHARRDGLAQVEAVEPQQFALGVEQGERVAPGLFDRVAAPVGEGDAGAEHRARRAGRVVPVRVPVAGAAIPEGGPDRLAVGRDERPVAGVKGLLGRRRRRRILRQDRRQRRREEERNEEERVHGDCAGERSGPDLGPSPARTRFRPAVAADFHVAD
ncbi:MAG: hypothetical protein FJ306_06855, partial [Planctomycetes bacterium]|nr:hypothetical protein [Planctomycetota bacterium]